MIIHSLIRLSNFILIIFLLDLCVGNVYYLSMLRKNIMITKKLEEKVQKVADEEGISFSEMLRRIMNYFFSKQGGVK